MGSSPIRVAILIPLASVAQLVEQRTENPRVVGSIPTGGTSDRRSLRGFSSFGRARPCQGRGGGFEPRNPLQKRAGRIPWILPALFRTALGSNPEYRRSRRYSKRVVPAEQKFPRRPSTRGFRALVGSGFLFVPSVRVSGLNPGSEPSLVQVFSLYRPCALSGRTPVQSPVIRAPP